MSGKRARVIAYYLPQFYPTPENDQWWGEGFTEWTNVRNARPLFPGHDQPKIPDDLGYYDLRLPETRQSQAELAKQFGVEGFCYWHYWFGNGRRALDRVFNEVLASGQPDFPFALAWANHSWYHKKFSRSGTDKLLIQQEYPGIEDERMHFNAVLSAFKDSRYIRVEEKPLFVIHNPDEIPEIKSFLANWQKWAIDSGLKGIHFVAISTGANDIGRYLKMGFQAVNTIRLYHFFKKISWPVRLYLKVLKKWKNWGSIVDYSRASRYFFRPEDRLEEVYPTLIPNWDHSPRSGRQDHIFINAHPEAFKKHAESVIQGIQNKSREHKIVFLKSWNEWGEGNYIEPDRKYGRQHLEALKEALFENRLISILPIFPILW